MARNTIKQTEDHDIVWTREEIGKVINRSARAVEYLMDRYPHEFPAKRVAGGYVASRRALLAWVGVQTEAA